MCMTGFIKCMTKHIHTLLLHAPVILGISNAHSPSFLNSVLDNSGSLLSQNSAD